jgi:hypothetical protein
MTPLSAALPGFPLPRLLALAGLLSTIAACASETANTTAPAPTKPPKPACSAPPPIHDIWKLEPMLTEQGLITSEMSREQKETAIRDYIRKKNQTFLNNCQEKK